MLGKHPTPGIRQIEPIRLLTVSRSTYCVKSLGVGILLAPIFGEAAGAGGGEDRLAEGFEDLSDFFEAGLDSVNFCEEFLDFGYDAFLFRDGSNWHPNLSYVLKRDVIHSSAPGVGLGLPLCNKRGKGET
jgi:hypothetical protein